MKNYEFKNESGYSIWVEAESQEEANKKFDELFKTKKVVNTN